MAIDWLQLFVTGAIGSVPASISAYFSFKSARKSEDASKDVATLNAGFGKDLKEHEYRLAHLKAVAGKRLEVYDAFSVLAGRLLKDEYPGGDTPGLDEWDAMEKFIVDWGNMIHHYIWLSDEAARQYLSILNNLLNIQGVMSPQLISFMDAKDREKKALEKAIEDHFPNINGKIMDFIRQLSHDYPSLHGLPEVSQPNSLPDKRLQKGLRESIWRKLLPHGKGPLPPDS